MKTQLILFIVVICLLLAASCKDGNNLNNSPPEPAPSITSISPEKGKTGTEVTITGSNFGVTPEANTVTFNGAEAVVTAANETELVAEVPEDAGSGSVVVTVAGQTATGPEFTWFPDNARFVNGGTGSDTDNDCYEPNEPCATIAYAIGQAAEGDLIDIAAGIYTEMLTIDKSISLQGAGQDIATGTVIQAHADSGLASGRVITIQGGNQVSISKVVIRHGKALGGSGGGIQVSKSTLNLTDVTIEKNVATYGGGMHIGEVSGTYTNVIFRDNRAYRSGGSHAGSGGGIYNFSSSPVLKEVKFINNRADWDAGGLYNTSNSNPILTDVTFTGNGANRFGGGIYNNSNPKLIKVTFDTNKAGSGGGMYNIDGDPILTDVVFNGNVATSNVQPSGGGGMYNTGESSPSLTYVSFKNNKALHLWGGGMFNEDGNPKLKNVTFIANEAFAGGGMFIRNGTPTITNGLFSSNKADYGGGMGIDRFNTLTFTNVIFSANEASINGGGISNNARVTLKNCIIWGNTANGNGNEINGIYPYSDITLNYCLYGNDKNDIINNGTPFVSYNSLTEDPLFVDPENGDFHLQSNSPAINKGDPDTDLSVFPIVDSKIVDLDGNLRVVGGRIDIGAYEVQEN